MEILLKVSVLVTIMEQISRYLKILGRKIRFYHDSDSKKKRRKGIALVYVIAFIYFITMGIKFYLSSKTSSLAAFDLGLSYLHFIGLSLITAAYIYFFIKA